MEFSRQEYWSGCHFLLQGIFPTQGSNSGFLHCRQILYCLGHQGSPGTVRTFTQILRQQAGGYVQTLAKIPCLEGVLPMGSCGQKRDAILSLVLASTTTERWISPQMIFFFKTPEVSIECDLLVFSISLPSPILGLRIQIQWADSSHPEALVIIQACKLPPESGGVEIGWGTQTGEDFWCRKTQGGIHEGPRTWAGFCKRKPEGREERANGFQTEGHGEQAGKGVSGEPAGTYGWSEGFTEGSWE